MYMDMRMAPTGSNHHTFCEVLAMAPNAMAPRLLTMSFLWSSASASMESAHQRLCSSSDAWQVRLHRQCLSPLQQQGDDREQAQPYLTDFSVHSSR